MGRRRPPIWTLAILLALAGCGSGDGDASSEESASASSAAVAGDPQSIDDLCGVDAEGEYVELRPEDGDSVLPGYEMGDGDDGVVLLHQIGGNGSCGWVGYAPWLAEQDVSVLAVDVCGSGESACSEDLAGDQAAQIELAVEHLRDGGAKRVTLVGASMGGAIAQGVAGGVDVDAVVAISPPPEWEGVEDVAAAADSITVPWLLVAAEDDSGIDPPRLKKARAGSGAPGEYRQVTGTDHGYELVTDGSLVDPVIKPLGKELPKWASGDLPER